MAELMAVNYDDDTLMIRVIDYYIDIATKNILAVDMATLAADARWLLRYAIRYCC